MGWEILYNYSYYWEESNEHRWRLSFMCNTADEAFGPVFYWRLFNEPAATESDNPAQSFYEAWSKVEPRLPDPRSMTTEDLRVIVSLLDPDDFCLSWTPDERKGWIDRLPPNMLESLGLNPKTLLFPHEEEKQNE